MTQRAEGGGKPITCSGKQQLSCKAIPPGLDALTTARVGICRPMGFRHLRCPKVSKGRAESPLVRPQAHTPCPGWGPDAPTTARMVGLPPRVGQYFLSKRKKVPKKARGTATPGKRLLLPILAAGLAMSRAMELDSFHQLLERARARLFPPSKWAGLFPSAAYRRSAPPQLASGTLKQR